LTNAYHPQSNEAVERLHRRLKDALRARAVDSNWSLHLPWIMLGIRAAPREDSGVLAVDLVYGSPLQLPGQLLTAAESPPADFVRQINTGMPCVESFSPTDTSATICSCSPASDGSARVHQVAGGDTSVISCLQRAICTLCSPQAGR
jgi:hypothetical protein